MSEQLTHAHVPEWDVADRMRKAARESHIGVQDMADYHGVSRTTVSTWINGRVSPSAQTLRLWAMRCGVPLDWLRSGTADTPPPFLGGKGVECARRDSNPQPSDPKVLLTPMRRVA